MKHIKTFENFLFESTFNGTAWHTSYNEIKSFRPIPSWFTANPVFAKVYHDNTVDGGDAAYTYEVKISGNILDQSTAKELAESLGINFQDLISDLTSNPSSIEKRKLIRPFIGKCDGFFHWDYDPTDGGDAESVLVFDPSRKVKIVKQMNY